MKKLLIGWMVLCGIMGGGVAAEEVLQSADKESASVSSKETGGNAKTTASSQENKTSIPQQVDLVGAGIFYIPKDDDDYDYGFGLEAQARFWLTKQIGLALSLGAASWQVKDQDGYYYDAYMVEGVHVEGDLTLLPIGGSILLRPLKMEKLDLVLELGVRYVFADSDITAEVGAADIFGNWAYAYDTVDVDDGFVGLVGMELAFNVSKEASLFLGVGYQFDISKGDMTWMGYDIAENELAAFLVTFGLAIHL